MSILDLEKHKDILHPPGGLMIWIFSLSEIFVFICAIGAFLIQKNYEPELFHESKLKLNQSLATINTLILITSSYFAAKAAHMNELKLKNKTLLNLGGSIVLGILFLLVKAFEYNEKASMNFVLGSNSFFDYYWILTAFHGIHVIIGVFILIWLFIYTLKEIEFKEQDLNFHTGINYWHLCDLIWLLIFPILYML